MAEGIVQSTFINMLRTCLERSLRANRARSQRVQNMRGPFVFKHVWGTRNARAGHVWGMPRALRGRVWGMSGAAVRGMRRA
eukprot:2898613-Lingulodinium_polyedra.AAC.1